MSRNPPHQWLLIIEPPAQEMFDTLTPSVKRTIFRHLRELLQADDPYNLTFVEMLRETKYQRMRKFRAGNFRVLYAIESVSITHLKHEYKGVLYLLDIWERKDAY
ncbi:MAG: hypothetical protein BroJett018_51230 [Chloroflexota bacterium]|nr:MAG: hypothetical protein BroJett018_51230 [Chloroflexota bacterium]